MLIETKGAGFEYTGSRWCQAWMHEAGFFGNPRRAPGRPALHGDRDQIGRATHTRCANRGSRCERAFRGRIRTFTGEGRGGEKGGREGKKGKGEGGGDGGEGGMGGEGGKKRIGGESEGWYVWQCLDLKWRVGIWVGDDEGFLIEYSMGGKGREEWGRWGSFLLIEDGQVEGEEEWEKMGGDKGGLEDE